jgi:hypothetical protein
VLKPKERDQADIYRKRRIHAGGGATVNRVRHTGKIPDKGDQVQKSRKEDQIRQATENHE